MLDSLWQWLLCDSWRHTFTQGLTRKHSVFGVFGGAGHAGGNKRPDADTVSSCSIVALPVASSTLTHISRLRCRSSAEELMHDVFTNARCISFPQRARSASTTKADAGMAPFLSSFSVTMHDLEEMTEETYVHHVRRILLGALC